MDLVEDALNKEPFLVDRPIHDLVAGPARILFDLLVACPKFVGDEGPQGLGIRKRNTVQQVCVTCGDRAGRESAVGRGKG